MARPFVLNATKICWRFHTRKELMAKEKTALLLVTIGLPRSGKSTWVREYAGGRPRSAIVSPDEVRRALHGDYYIPSVEDMVWAIVKLMVKALFRAGHTTVILDGTFNTKKYRAPWMDFSPWDNSQFTVTTEFLCFSTSAEVCIARARHDERADLIPVIERMAKMYEAPDTTEPHTMVSSDLLAKPGEDQNDEASSSEGMNSTAG